MKCKHCGQEKEAEFVDIGIGSQQVTPWQCTNESCPELLEWHLKNAELSN